ncbi:MAG TPA: SRPBCC family protein [Anaerolineales bacterium]|nr:SRPBCC family protein [Anaerolineales bacterium]
MTTTIRTHIDIGAPPGDVAAVILDASKAALWTADLERFEVVTGTPGLVGSKARLHYIQNGRRYTMEDELLEVEPNRRYLSRVSGDALVAEVETRLTPSAGGTRVDVRWSGKARPFMLRLMLPFLRGAIARQALGDLVKLKQIVEAPGEKAG